MSPPISIASSGIEALSGWPPPVLDPAGPYAGSIGVLGPARMNYPEAMAAVAAVSRRLGDRLTSET